MTKIISISDEAYNGLKEIKAKGESFSKVIVKVIEKEKRKPLLDFLGKWPGSKGELERIKKNLAKERKAFRTREVRFN